MMLGDEFDFHRERRAALHIIIAVWLLVGVLYLIPYVVSAGTLKPADGFAHLAISIMGIAVSIALFPILRALRKQRGAQVLPTIALIVFAISMACAMLDVTVYDTIRSAFGEQGHPGESTYATRIAANFAVYVSQFALVTALVWTVETNLERKANEREMVSAKATASEAQTAVTLARLSALRYQLNPHFLFNCLNSISSLVIARRGKEAEEMLMRLSAFLRATLKDDAGIKPSLQQEFELIEAYLQIEKVRFGEKMAIEVNCPAALCDARVPSLILQPLVENAIKYAVAPSKEPVEISISAHVDPNGNLVLVVSDTGRAGPAPGTPSLGVGIANIRDRLANLYGNDGEILTRQGPDGFTALVRFPLDLCTAPATPALTGRQPDPLGA